MNVWLISSCIIANGLGPVEEGGGSSLYRTVRLSVLLLLDHASVNVMSQLGKPLQTILHNFFEKCFQAKCIACKH